MKYSILKRRSVISVTGKDKYSFLQGLLTNNVDRLQHGDQRMIYSLMLTPQGKIFCDFFLFDDKNKDRILLDIPRDLAELIIKRLLQYKLRSDVIFEDLDEVFSIAIAFEAVSDAFAADPRHVSLGYRAILPAEVELSKRSHDEILSEYEDKRISLLIPDAMKDFEPEQFFPIELGFQKLNAIDYNKGCYVGQEVTARTTHRGVLRKELKLIIANDGNFDAADELRDTTYTMLGSHNEKALALVRKI